MAESFCFGQVIGGAADGCKLQALGSLIVQKRNLLIIRPADPTTGHDVRNRSDVWIVDLMKWRRRNLLFFFSGAGYVTEHSVAAAGHFGCIAVGEKCRRSKARSDIGAFENVRTCFVI